MEALLTTIGPHVTSFFNLYVMKLVNTGDRMMDTTIQMICSTIIGATITGIIALYVKKGLWADFRNRLRCLWNSKAYNPKEFDPLMASGTAASGAMFLYKLAISKSEITYNSFIHWFFEAHGHKKYTIPKLEFAFPVLDLTDTTLKTGSNLHTLLGYASTIPNGTYIPIWRSRFGYWVYYTTQGKSMTSGYDSLCSDSLEAIKECIADIKQVCVKETELMANAVKKNEPLQIYESDVNGLSVAIKNGYIPINKTFDTLFFTDKTTILPILQKFKDKTLFPKHLPLDTKLGFLLHGPPGTGKTGFVSCVANFLQKHPYIVDMSKIKTRAALDAILAYPAYSNFWVFEEFDTMECVQKRQKAPAPAVQLEQIDPNNPQAMYMMMLAKDNKEYGEEMKREMAASKDKLDLGYLLRKLDGLESADGRLIIATTNHPERIDPALLRPGRFGYQIHLSRATKQMVRDIVGMIYQSPISEEDVEGIEDLKWSPAEILQHGVVMHSASELLQFLRESEPERD